MLKKLVLILIVLIFSLQVSSQNTGEPLVKLSDLRFHSEFERESIKNFIEKKTDTFNILLAVDKDITPEKSLIYYNIYQSVFKDLNNKKLDVKDFNKKINFIYTTVHNKFLKRYNEIEFIPSTFQSGSYNCVSGSIIYALVFEQLKIPYKIMVSSNHVYLIVNPDSESILIESTSPSIEKSIINESFTKEFFRYFNDSELVNEDTDDKASVEEIYEQTLKKVHEVSFTSLPGLQYYNMALIKLRENNIRESYEYFQKSYFFYPNKQIRIFLYSALFMLLDSCPFANVEDIDYVAQFSMFNEDDIYMVPRIFGNILKYYLQFTDKKNHCDSLYNRLIQQLPNQKLKDEVSFTYYSQLCKVFHSNDLLEYYSYEALKLKPGYREAKDNFKRSIDRKCKQIYDYKALLDTVQNLKKRYTLNETSRWFSEYEMIAYLGFAYDYYKQKKPEDAEIYLQKFENSFSEQISNRDILIKITDAYRIKAEYYSTTNKAKEKEALETGLKYVPNSSLLKSLLEQKGYNK